jgi:hypothetical protein
MQNFKCDRGTDYNSERDRMGHWTYMLRLIVRLHKSPVGKRGGERDVS